MKTQIGSASVEDGFPCSRRICNRTAASFHAVTPLRPGKCHIEHSVLCATLIIVIVIVVIKLIMMIIVDDDGRQWMLKGDDGRRWTMMDDDGRR